MNCLHCAAEGKKVPATKRASTIGGPRFHLCDEHTSELIAAAREAGVSLELELLDPPTGGPQ